MLHEKVHAEQRSLSGSSKLIQQTLYAELLLFLLKEDLVKNGYSLFAEKVISEPQYAEEFIKSFQFSLATTLSRF